ncbi:hypothetical protein [Croceicoccus naphthovorans]|uniref:Uncharacterized protein n=1 Tax=Croceicoccus naphthovorans TaxID=1348774 RepID=A0A0G3XE31_9SPHN|nr:hypothetical protein [Croceicoccus naphthovorans]AKM08901.1 hypothetical protein AB433_01180 [Croceicoccus naphthovorans]MBB3989327.1 hypothetical protein [Croceicoccus naphthovorans]
MRKSILLLTAAASGLAMSGTAYAKPGDPIAIGDGVTIDPIIEGVLRYEAVDQDDIDLDADAVTVSVSAGAEIKASGFSVLAEAEGTLAIVDNYNAYPFPIDASQRRPEYSVIADPENVELNRLQVGYFGKFGSVTVGRQRIVLGNSRFVGNVGWRQNEQTFDAARATVKIGPAYLDGTYAISQRSIFGMDADARRAMEGEHILLNAGVKVAGVDLTGFAYILDYDDDEPAPARSSQTYGAIASGKIPLGDPIALTFTASYAKQSDLDGDTIDYSADYLNGELGTVISGVKLLAGYEKLGSDDGLIGFSTPMATLHKFNGFADLFLNTPATGIEDYYGSLGYAFKGVTLGVTYHKFESDVGGLDYGSEWDATAGFKLGGYPFLIKYANYDAEDFGTDTEKLWVQVSFAY